MTFGDKLTTSGVEDGKPLQHVLDVGTGTGIWAIEYGETSLSSTNLAQLNIMPVKVDLLTTHQ